MARVLNVGDEVAVYSNDGTKLLFRAKVTGIDGGGAVTIERKGETQDIAAFRRLWEESNAEAEFIEFMSAMVAAGIPTEYHKEKKVLSDFEEWLSLGWHSNRPLVERYAIFVLEFVMNCMANGARDRYVVEDRRTAVESIFSRLERHLMRLDSELRLDYRIPQVAGNREWTFDPGLAQRLGRKMDPDHTRLFNPVLVLRARLYRGSETICLGQVV